jgi:hypothetical protein
MAQIANVSLVQELKLFGGRVFDFTESAALRRAATEAPRRLSRGARPRDLFCAFKALSEAVEGLDRIARTDAGRAVEASALAQEGALLLEEIYDLIGT